MENYLLLGVIVIAAIIVSSIKISSSSEKRKVFKNNVYSYTARPLLMSKVEAEFFNKLAVIVEERYYIFPQVHLSAIFDHKINGQDWGSAFKHINSKSVDYVLCDRSTLVPVYAIELDDFTHNRSDRIQRDGEVERIFRQARLPLVRFKNKDASESEIIQALTSAKSSMVS